MKDESFHCNSAFDEEQKAPYLPPRTILANRYFVGALISSNGEGASYIAEIVKIMEDIVDGQATIGKTPDYLMTKLDCGVIYDLYEKALACATGARTRNNIRMMRMAFRYSDVEYRDPCHKPCSVWLMDYEDPTGELAYLATNYDSFYHNYTGYGIDFPLSNTDTKDFQPDKWYQFE